MKFFSGLNNVRIKTLLGAGSVALGLAAAVNFCAVGEAYAEGAGGGEAPASASASAEPFTELAVVDFDKLLKDRPGYERIEELDEQIRLMQRELEFLPLADRKRLIDSGRKRMEREVLKARKELEAESRRISHELDNYQSNLKAQLEREGKAIGDQYNEILRRKIEALKPKAPEVPVDVRRSMDSFMRDLAVVRQQRISARRLELERAMQSALEAEQAGMENKLAEYDSSLMVANQERRVNLQLQLQTAATPEEESSIQEQLNALGDEEAQKKEAKRKELGAAYDARVAEERARVSSEMQSFEKTLDAETGRKADAERNRLLSTVKIPDPAANKAEVEAQIAKTRAAVNAEMEAKKASMTATMQAKAEKAREHMKQKQAQIEKRLQATQKQLEDMVNRSSADVSEDTRKKMDSVKAKIEELTKQRNDLYDGMVADLREVVSKVAEQQENKPSVIGAYVVNVDCLDLTDKTMIALEKKDQH